LPTTTTTAALAARYRDLDALADAILQRELPSDVDIFALPVYCPPSLAPRDTFHVWSYSSARQICGADGRDLELRPDVQITVRGSGDAAGWTAHTENGAVVVTRPDETKETFCFGAIHTFSLDVRGYSTADARALRELQSTFATAILAHEANPPAPCPDCGTSDGVYQVGSVSTDEPGPCRECNNARFDRWNQARGAGKA
jgi:hypothetical protein